MKRRDFIKQSASLTAVGALGLSNCGDLNEFYSFDGTIRNGISWINFQLAVNFGVSGTGADSVQAKGPTVIKDGSVYKMWYAGENGSIHKILYCESTDGINWSNYSVAIDHGSEGTYDNTSTNTPLVIKINSTYKMYYAGSSTGNTLWRIIYCESQDGINWQNFKVVHDWQGVLTQIEGVNDINGAQNPTIVHDNGVYKMWYAGLDGGAITRIIYCDSLDGINWQNFQLSINLNSQGLYDTTKLSGPSVIKDGNLYKMWYAGNDGGNWRIIYCESTDGINWSNFHLSVDISSQGIYDTNHSTTPAVINIGGVGKMWYAGDNGINRRILYCESY